MPMASLRRRQCITKQAELYTCNKYAISLKRTKYANKSRLSNKN